MVLALPKVSWQHHMIFYTSISAPRPIPEPSMKATWHNQLGGIPSWSKLVIYVLKHRNDFLTFLIIISTVTKILNTVNFFFF